MTLKGNYLKILKANFENVYFVTLVMVVEVVGCVNISRTLNITLILSYAHSAVQYTIFFTLTANTLRAQCLLPRLDLLTHYNRYISLQLISEGVVLAEALVNKKKRPREVLSYINRLCFLKARNISGIKKNIYRT